MNDNGSLDSNKNKVMEVLCIIVLYAVFNLSNLIMGLCEFILLNSSLYK